MTELGELQRRVTEFSQRHTRLIVVSIEDRKEAQKTQGDHPDLYVVADNDRALSSVADVLHPHSAPDGGDTAAPATLLVDREGIVRWVFRPSHYLSRLSPDELLAAIDQSLPAK